MIHADQPTCFPDDIIIALSSKNDSTMLNRSVDMHDPSVIKARELFCNHIGVRYSDTVYQEIEYGHEQTYELLVEVSDKNTTQHLPGVHADALFTSERGVGLFLPVADCVATVVYDPKAHMLALLHLGRHSTLTSLVGNTVEHFVTRGSDPEDILVWMSPSAGRESYRLDWFDYADNPDWQGYYTKNEKGYFLDLAGYNAQRFIESGISPANITVSSVDTVRDPNYFSHMTGDVTGRIAVLAMMR